jgi:TM2 domain-containing membrane protein YozV
MGKKSVGLALILSWVVPGCGHLYLGKRVKAIIFFVLIVGAFFYGMWLSDFNNVSPARYKLAAVAQAFSGFPAVAGLAIDQTKRGVINEGPQIFDVSLVYTCVAGLLNLLVVIDAIFLASKGDK